MKYPAFFLLLSVTLTFVIADSDQNLRWLLLWPIANGIVMSLAYLTNLPGLIAGKQSNGKLNPTLAIINLPWLALTWIVFYIYKSISHEEPYSKIEGTEIFIGRYPSHNAVTEFKNIYDLTAEFPASSMRQNGYSCFANLDAVVLTAIPQLPVLNPTEKTLVHCAQGHGRSATWLSIQLFQCGIFQSTEQALAAIQRSRPGAKPSKAQLAQLSMANQQLKGR